ncbi:MAG: hypothetical protein IT305_07560 [Chloroflexi bacterium]|nr:hypothetical protein [Chloroflexota bacterium]
MALISCPGRLLLGERRLPFDVRHLSPSIGRWRRPAGLDSPLTVALTGAAGGFVGTLVLTTAMRVVERVRTASDGTAASQAAAGVPADEDTEPTAPPERLAARMGSMMLGTEPSPGTRRSMAFAIHWTYGMLWGAVYAPIQASLPLPTSVHGVLLGLLVWSIGPMRLIPALGLSSGVPRRTLAGRLRAIGLHLLYGWAASWTIARLGAGRMGQS